MDSVVALAALVAGIVVFLVAFDYVALRWGADSREPIGDDWQRRIPSWHH